jgi:formylglycine-generating enzyme required for sulfatase activity
MIFFKLLFLLLIAMSANAQISGGLPPVKKSEPQKSASSQTKSNNTQVKSEEQIAVEREDAFWNEIKTLASKEAYEIYIKRYPNGKYVEVAKANIQSLTTIAPTNISQNNSLTQPSQLRPGATFKDCLECPLMVVIPQGKFLMGAQPGDEDNQNIPDSLKNRSQPQHVVNVKSFLAGMYEVTVSQYAAFVLATKKMHLGSCNAWNGSKFEPDPSKDWKNPGFSQYDDHPVVCVSSSDATEYVRWLKQKTGKEYRLLSEAEWEYAARGGEIGPWFWGSDRNLSCLYANYLDQQAKFNINGFGAINVPNCNDGNSYTSTVGYYKPNAFGLHDMLGNVSEWTQDCLNLNYVGAPTDGSAWLTGRCTATVIRGGSWNLVLSSVARRGFALNEHRSTTTGFRVALSN